MRYQEMRISCSKNDKHILYKAREYLYNGHSALNDGFDN